MRAVKRIKKQKLFLFSILFFVRSFAWKWNASVTICGSFISQRSRYLFAVILIQFNSFYFRALQTFSSFSFASDIHLHLLKHRNFHIHCTQWIQGKCAIDRVEKPLKFELNIGQSTAFQITAEKRRTKREKSQADLLKRFHSNEKNPVAQQFCITYYTFSAFLSHRAKPLRYRQTLAGTIHCTSSEQMKKKNYRKCIEKKWQREQQNEKKIRMRACRKTALTTHCENKHGSSRVIHFFLYFPFSAPSDSADVVRHFPLSFAFSRSHWNSKSLRRNSSHFHSFHSSKSFFFFSLFESCSSIFRHETNFVPFSERAAKTKTENDKKNYCDAESFSGDFFLLLFFRSCFFVSAVHKLMKIKWEIWNLVMDERKNLAFWYYVISVKTNYDKVLFTYSLLCCCRLCCTNQMSEKTRATTHARAEDGRETKTEKLWLRFALRRLWLREETKTEMKRQWRYDDVPIVGMSKRHKTLSSTLIVNRNKIEWTKWFNAKRRINRIKTNSASFIANWKLKTQERKWQREERIFSKENFSEHFFFSRSSTLQFNYFSLRIIFALISSNNDSSIFFRFLLKR